jgi:hypothetical protein
LHSGGMWVLAGRELRRAGATAEQLHVFTAAFRAAPTREERIETIRRYVDLTLIGHVPDLGWPRSQHVDIEEVSVGGLHQTTAALQQALRSGDVDMTRHLLVVLMRDLFDDSGVDDEPTFIDACMPTLLAALAQESD